MISGKDFLKSHVLSWRERCMYNLQRCYIFWQSVPGLRANNSGKARLPTVDEWPTRQWCDRQIAGERSRVRRRSVPTIVAVQGMLVGQPVQHFPYSPVLSAPVLPLVTGMWPLAPNDGSVWVFEGLRHRSLDMCTVRKNRRSLRSYRTFGPLFLFTSFFPLNSPLYRT